MENDNIKQDKVREPEVILKGKSIDMTKKKNIPTVSIVVGVVITLLAGIGTGYTLSRSSVKGVSTFSTISQQEKGSENKKTVGLTDKTFKDSAEGILVEGGIDGEGTHHLEREGGPSQNVYLVSSVIALNDYVGKKVKVWGQTYRAKKAGWLMDVGKLEELD